MQRRSLETFGDCSKHRLGIVAECLGCGRKVQFSAAQLAAHFQRRKLPGRLAAVGGYFVCRGRGAIRGCGHRGARLSPAFFEPPPEPPGAPPALAEYVPGGVDPKAWARARDDRQRRWLIRKARG